MQKKQLNLVSHSHWDREWYLSHAQHNYRLVKLMDTLIDLLEKNVEFRSFHLDGQVILINDYLSVRPQQKDKIKELIRQGRLKIGPFYILQDEFLISGEANIRNVLYGLQECEKYGTPSMVGYFPDAFGNIGQMPQILSGFHLDSAFFGRGIIPTGYANEVLGKSDEGFSEIIWQGVDGSKVIGVQFVNWYCNAYQIPTDEDRCVDCLKVVMENAELAARTPYLLGMNGCDHQPVQTDLTDVFRIAKKHGLDVVHTSLEEYVGKIKPYRDSFYRFCGEIVGQNGSGFGTLIGTASSRIYLKQLNYQAQCLLEKKLEPLSVMAQRYGVPYDKDVITWCWKKLMENHPHDSICGCGVDSVHAKMKTRFLDVIDTATSLLEDVKQHFSAKVAADADKNILVFNPDIHTIEQVVETFVDYKEGESHPENLSVVNDRGEEVLSSCEYLGTVPTFILPEDRFREVYQVTRYRIRFLSKTQGVSFSRYRVAEKMSELPLMHVSEKEMENRYLKVTFNRDGSFNLYQKEAKTDVQNQNYFIEIGDKGTEYEFLATGEQFTTKNRIAKFRVVENSPVRAVVQVQVPLMQQNGKEAVINSDVMLDVNAKEVKIRTSFENQCENHRIRAIFDCDYRGNAVYADGQFDITERKIHMGSRWKNEHNPQRFTAFVMRKSAKEGSIIGARGLNEYEISTVTNATEITLVRSVGEMGDWFYFPTADSQCKGEIAAEYSVALWNRDTYDEAINRAYIYYADPLMTCVVNKQEGAIKESESFVRVDADSVLVMSCLKMAEKSDKLILRVYNPTDSPCAMRLNKKYCLINMGEDMVTEQETETILPKKIVTVQVGIN